MCLKELYFKMELLTKLAKIFDIIFFEGNNELICCFVIFLFE